MSLVRRNAEGFISASPGRERATRNPLLANLANFAYIADNPRVESLWQYLKRTADYRTGIVSTADITDATPAAEGAYSGFRQTRFEIARQYLENPMLNGQPAFEVLLCSRR